MLKNLIKSLTLSLVLIGLLIICSGGCEQRPAIKVINLERVEAPKEEEVFPEEKHIRIAIGGMITPREGFGYYKQLLDYIGEKLQRPVEFVDRGDYAEINKLIATGDVDLAFVCGGPYVEGHDKFGMQLLVAPQSHAGTVYYSYIIVSIDSPINSFEGLRGKSFAFTDPLSNSGKLVPMYMLAKMGETPDSYFKSYIYTHKHDKSIMAVAQKIVDAAAVDSLIWEYVNQVNPELTAKTKIVAKSPPYGIPPVVVRPGLDPEFKRQLREIFLDIHKDARGREILDKMQIDKFVIIDDAAYNSIREMQSFVAMQKKKKQEE